MRTPEGKPWAVGQRNQWGYNPTDGSTGGMHASHLREATIERNVGHGLRRRLTIVLALLCVLPIETLAQKADTAQNPPAPLGKLVDVGGYRVHLYCTGTGSPTVVIVGAGFSFNWGLIQPEVAKFTQVCSYDHSGIGWSESGPKDSCSLRVSEVHTALKTAGIKGPSVLVGHSLGGLVARLYAGQYPDEVAGMVFVDHALPSDFS